ncbi:PD-(D/E)XK nuclease family protein [Lutibacter sp. A80]|uniref:PDDEXK-like family protein n=1 Tax=Lutibacter sp. A80 TaxID=2918453 RepID=UPI001F054FE0|nr:PD-(D/E)XK nuclease family protein [Lutibacter sp. A80]UMB61604.1 PD-(D/E)XK nuclease family protein [Lutibacter sp. A80]
MKNEQYLLSQIQRIVDDENKIRKSKEEDFNIFLITNKTSDERYTHSAFIAELLNPKGSHHKGDVFLKKFVEIISKNIPDENPPERVEPIFKEYSSYEIIGKTIVSKEINIGRPVYIDKSNKGNSIGGNIDILLELNGYYIAIENKIYANLQEKQIERYKNYKPDKNIVFYLTLDGRPAKEKGVTINKDYYCISYYREIDEWLMECHLLSASQPILRESIRQYQLLIQKLSGKMKYSKDVQEEILKNFEAADSLYSNFNGALNEIKKNFRNSIIEALNRELKEKFIEEFDEAKEFNPIDNNFAKIYIKHKKYKDNAKVYFAIDSFSGKGHPQRNGMLYGGVFVEKGKENIAKMINQKSSWNWWPIEVCLFKDSSLRDTSTLKSLHTNENKREEAINEITNTMITFIKQYKDSVFKANQKYIQI